MSLNHLHKLTHPQPHTKGTQTLIQGLPGSDEDGVKVLPGLGGKMNGPRAILLQVNNP